MTWTSSLAEKTVKTIQPPDVGFPINVVRVNRILVHELDLKPSPRIMGNQYFDVLHADEMWLSSTPMPES
jgi:hypothetical protein